MLKNIKTFTNLKTGGGGVYLVHSGKEHKLEESKDLINQTNKTDILENQIYKVY